MILDAGNGVVWKDDAQVVALEVSKIWVPSAKEEGVMIQCAEVEPEDAVELWDGESPLN
jgi:Holliday junction resolvase RusA-like endonuclease